MACELHLNKAVINTFKKTSTKIPMNLLGKVRERETWKTQREGVFGEHRSHVEPALPPVLKH